MKKIPSEKKYNFGGEIKKEPSYNPQPNVMIDETHLPEIKDWNIGEEYPLYIKVKMTGIKHEEYGDKKGKVVADFKITQIGTHKE